MTDVHELLDTDEQTLLGVCPMSPKIVRATLREAAETAFAPMFIATPRQVDADRGYTPWSQAEFREFVAETAAQAGYDGPIVLARDHGGPYQNTRDRGDPSVPTDRAMQYAREVFYADLAAGFDVLHVDATEDPSVDGPLPIPDVVDRTVRLIEAVETRRREAGHDPVAYEVGTEEIAGGLTDPDSFERYIDSLSTRLAEAGLETAAERVVFVVGQVGTTMRVDMRNQFDPERARRLVDVAAAHDMHVKVHYTDWLDDDALARFPDLGVGAANVGPEFAAAQVEALADLDRRERDLAARTDVTHTGYLDALEEAVVAGDSWRRLAPDGLDERETARFAERHRRQIALVHGRYVMNGDRLRGRRRDLKRTIAAHTDLDPDEYVLDAIQSAVHRYVEAFGLRDSARGLEAV
jgi:tagatose-1,6-bisphosphate aldolase non-catalytic subunit AgaZ/GatZ